MEAGFTNVEAIFTDMDARFTNLDKKIDESFKALRNNFDLLHDLNKRTSDKIETVAKLRRAKLDKKT